MTCLIVCNNIYFVKSLYTVYIKDFGDNNNNFYIIDHIKLRKKIFFSKKNNRAYTLYLPYKSIRII